MTASGSVTVERLLLAFAAQQRSRRRLGLLFTPIGLVLVAPEAVAAAMRSGSDGLLALAVIGSLIALVGLAGVVGYLLSSPGVASVGRALRERPADLVWVYGFEQYVNGVLSRASVILRTRDGKQVDLDVKVIPPATKADVLAFVQELNPAVLLGFDEDNKKRYGELVRGG